MLLNRSDHLMAAFENIPYFKEWNLRTLTDRQNMFRDLALKTWGFEQMPFFSSTLGE
jgi:hypothetical protein